MARPIYLDNHATTRVDPRVLEAMLPTFTEAYGNAGSTAHAFGWEARAAVERARTQLAELLGVESSGVVFTSGATESNNLAILGALPADPSGSRVVTATTEHPSVLDTCASLRARGAELTVLPVDAQGRLDPGELERALERPAALVSLMAANNEIGTIQPVAELSAVCRVRGVVFHTDAAQAVGRVPVDLSRWGADMLSLSGHKFYGPKGVGALVLRPGTSLPSLRPQQHGGGQEGGRRPGTSNVHGIVGLGAAAAIAKEELGEESARIRALRDLLESGLREGLGGLVVNGHPSNRLPGNLSLSFPDLDAEALLLALPRLAVSAGAACSTGDPRPSHVLSAIGCSAETARSTLRFGLGRFTTREEIEEVIPAVVAAARELGGAAAV